MKYKWTILGIVLNITLFAIGLHLGRFQLGIAFWTYGIPMPLAVIGKVFICRVEGCNREFDNAQSRQSHETHHKHPDLKKYLRLYSESAERGKKEFWSNPITRAIGCANNAVRTPARDKVWKKFVKAGQEANRGLKRTPEHIAKLTAGVAARNIQRGIEYRRKHPVTKWEKFFLEDVLDGNKNTSWIEFTGLVEQTVYNERGEPVLPYNHVLRL